MKQIKVAWVGIRPLVMHNGRLADPTDKFSKALKEISSKRKKTDADYDAMSRIEFEGGLYWDDEHGPVMPSDCIEACLAGGAKKNRLGKDVQAAVFVSDEVVPIKYSGPRNVDKMFADPKFVLKKGVKVTTSRVIRTRPMIPTGWRLEFTVEFDDSIINESGLRKAMEDAGALVGLCDWRPRFGRFLVE